MSQNDINTKTSQVVDRDAEQTEENLSEQRQIRRDKLKALQDADRNPFVVEKWNVRHTAWILRRTSMRWRIRRFPSQEEL